MPLNIGAKRHSGDVRAVARAAPGLVVPLWNEAACRAACCTISQEREREGKGSGVDREEAGKKIEEVRRGGSGRCGFGRSLLFLPYYDKKSSDE